MNRPIISFTRRTCIAATAAMVLARDSHSEQSLPVIGVLDSSAATAAKLSAFYDGLKVEGFFRNGNFTAEYHSAEGDYARLPDLASNLANRPVTLISALGVPAALAAKAAMRNIPVVFAIGPDPVEIGLLASLGHRTLNMTGVTTMASDRQRKRLELLYASIPRASTLGLLVNPRNPQADAQIKDTVSAAQAAGLEIKLIRASAGQNFPDAFAELAQSPARGLVIADDDLFLSAGPELGALAGNHRIPAIFESPGFAAAGGLMSYGTRLAEFYHQAGSYSGMVLAGAAAAEVPLYRSTGIDMTVNLRSAKALGIAVPQAIIDQASSLIQ